MSLGTAILRVRGGNQAAIKSTANRTMELKSEKRGDASMRTKPKLLPIMGAFIFVGLAADLLPHPGLGSGLVLSAIDGLRNQQSWETTTVSQTISHLKRPR